MNSVILQCQSCQQKLRVPSDKAKLEVTCPKCRFRWEWDNPYYEHLHKAGVNDPGIFAGITGSAENYADNVIMGAARGHGFAAEKANHLYDRFSGKDSKIVGGDNLKDGADRIVNGIEIQTKYCSTGSKCVSEAFNENGYRYWSKDGKPMLLEVPSDKYDDAIKAMEERIRRGQVDGVTDPAKAKEIIKKGEFTYQQVRNIAKAGTIESLTYDAANGIQLAATSMGISAVVSFAMQMWNGKSFDVALKSACYTGLQVGGIAWVSSILAAQVGRTGIEQSLRGTTDWMVKQLGYKASAWLANGLRSGKDIYGAAAANYLSKVLRGNIVTGALTTVILSSADFVRLFSGKVSGAQVFKNVTQTAAGVAGGTGGWMGGAAAGAALGSMVPIIGTAAGGIIGGILGSFAGGTAASTAASKIMDQFIEDDAKEMLRIFEGEFAVLGTEFLLNEAEAKEIIKNVTSGDFADLLRDMYSSDDRKLFARLVLEPAMVKVTNKRTKIKLPSNAQLLQATREVLEDLADHTQLATI